MMGAMLCLGFAAAFGANSIIARRGMLRASVNYVANITILSGPVFFLLLAVGTGEIFSIGQFSWKTYVFFAISGIVHFALGRTFSYRAIQLIGSTRTNLVTDLNPVVSISLAILVLKESLTLVGVLGILLSFSGPILIALKEHTIDMGVDSKRNLQSKDVDRPTLHRGLLIGAVSAVFWGSSAVFVKLGLENGGTPIAGSLVAYSAATLAVLPSFLRKESLEELFTQGREVQQLALLSGLATNLGQMFRFLALGYVSVITLALVSRTIPIWILLFAFLFNRKHESFSRWVLLGNGLLLTGTVLVVTQ